MTKDGRKKKAWGYEPNVPRCSNCAEYQSGGGVLNQRPMCKAGKFPVKPNACCDKWHKDNEVLA